MIEKASLERVEEKGREGLKGEMEERERGLQKKLGEVNGLRQISALRGCTGSNKLPIAPSRPFGGFRCAADIGNRQSGKRKNLTASPGMATA